MYDSFDNTYQATIGIDFLVKTVTVRGRSVRLQLWDTAGQERFRSLIPCYIRESGLALVVYDITYRPSFDLTSKWIDEIRGERGNDVIIMLIGNKVDLEEKRQISTEEGKKKAVELKALFMETSAKNGYNVKEVFNRVVMEIPDDEVQNKGKEEQIKLIAEKPAVTSSACYEC